MTSAVTLSDAAAAHVKTLIADDGRPGLMLRLAVNGGGCSGFQYDLDLDDAQGEDDVLIMDKGVTIAVDCTSLEIVAGTEIDFVEDLMGAAFRFNNPHASATCGCGSSFSV